MHLLRDQKAYQKCEGGGEKLRVYDASEECRNIKQKESKHIELVGSWCPAQRAALLGCSEDALAIMRRAAGRGWVRALRTPARPQPRPRAGRGVGQGWSWLRSGGLLPWCLFAFYL